MNFDLTLAIDFDGTLVEHNYPHIGKPIQVAFDTLKRLREELDCKLILWTCREGIFLEKAVQFCHENGLFFDAINTNVSTPIGFGHPKILADFYIDDRTPGWFNYSDEERWSTIEGEIRKRAEVNLKNLKKEMTP